MEGNNDIEDERLLEGVRVTDKELKKMVKEDSWDDRPLVYGNLERPLDKDEEMVTMESNIHKN